MRCRVHVHAARTGQLALDFQLLLDWQILGELLHDVEHLALGRGVGVDAVLSSKGPLSIAASSNGSRIRGAYLHGVEGILDSRHGMR